MKSLRCCAVALLLLACANFAGCALPSGGCCHRLDHCCQRLRGWWRGCDHHGKGHATCQKCSKAAPGDCCAADCDICDGIPAADLAPGGPAAPALPMSDPHLPGPLPPRPSTVEIIP